jgi:NAD(P)H-dependent FMN reductase
MEERINTHARGMTGSMEATPTPGGSHREGGSMNLIAINGSYRKKGNTTAMIEGVLKGYRDAGGQARHIMLIDHNIKTCLGCTHCFNEKDAVIGTCVHTDDMKSIIESILSADALIVGSPVYWGNVSSVMANFIHRLTPLGYDKSLDGGFKGVPVLKLKPVKPGAIVSSSIAPFPINLFPAYRVVYGFLKHVLTVTGYRSSFALRVGGAYLGTPIPERTSVRERAFRIGRGLSER